MRTEQGWWVTPGTVKAVVVDDSADTARVLLCHNPRGEWELPGGWPERGEATLAEVAQREVREETGLEVRAAEVLLVELLEVVPDERRLVVAVLARPVADPVAGPVAAAAGPAASHEHSEVGWFAVDDLPGPLAPLYAEAIRRATVGRDAR